MTTDQKTRFKKAPLFHGSKAKQKAEKHKAIMKAIQDGHEFWKDNPMMPSQSTYDLALSITVRLKEAGFKIVKA